MSEIHTPIWVKLQKFLTDSVKKYKQLLIGIIIGMLIVVPFTFKSYQILETELLVSDDLIVYNDMYLFTFGEIGNAETGDMLLTVWFNITAAQHVLIGIYFKENTQIKRIGIMSLDDVELLRDIKNPSVEVLVQLEDTQIGKYSCSIFFNGGNNTFIDVSVFYLS